MPRPPRLRPCPRAAAAAGALLLAALAGAPAGAGTPPPGFVDSQLIPPAEVPLPTAIAYEPGSGDLWVLDKGAGVRQGEARVRVRDAVTGVVSTALTLDCVDSRGERGLLGIAFDPFYLDPGGADRYVYLFYTRRVAVSGDCSIAGAPEASRNRVSRFSESAGLLSGEELILEGPDLTAARNHNGGTVRFAPDGTLFISVGDNDTDADPNPLSRDLGDQRGKLLRVHRDGTIPADNPFVDQPDALPEIWAFGLRNPFRFSIDEESAAPVIADVGEGTWEAVYLGVPGADYGYPCFEGSAPFRACDPEPAAGSVTDPIYEYHHGALTPPVSGDSITGGPVYRHAHPAAGVAGTSGGFPAEYEGSYFFGDYVDNWIRRGRIAGGRLEQVEMFMPDATRVVDMAVSPAGCLTWVSIGGDGVRDVCYVGGANSQPTARASATPASGLAPLDVQFSGSQSSDPDSDELAYSWQFGDAVESALADPGHLYPATGVYQAQLTVDDQQMAANSTDAAAPLRIVVGNRSPAATIAAPAAGTTYDAGDTVTFGGGALDPEDGTLGPESLSWTVVFHHDVHTHPFLGPVSGVAGGEFTIPDSGEDSTDVFYRVHLTATDSGAPLGATGVLSHTTSIDLLPNVVPLTLAAFPPGFGLELELDQQTLTAPASRDSIVGFPRTIGAPTPQAAGGRTFTFDSWSDGGAAEHQIITPGAATTYTAAFAVDCAAVDDLVLSDDQVDGAASWEACVSITAGPAYEVVGGGDLRLIAGHRVILGNGFAARDGGRVAILVVPMI